MNLDAGIPTDAPADTIVCQPGDYGLVIHPNNAIDLLVPPGEENKPITDHHKALLGAAISFLGDPEMLALLVKRYEVALTPANKVAT